MNDKRLWYCSACEFFHTLDAICPKSGFGFETMKLASPIAFSREEKRVMTLPKVKKHGK